MSPWQDLRWWVLCWAAGLFAAVYCLAVWVLLFLAVRWVVA